MSFNMRSFLSVITNLILGLSSAQQALALGINCRGSSNCISGTGGAMGQIAKAMDAGIAAGYGGDYYGTGSSCSTKLSRQHS